jgi:hypothetical protein
MHVYESLASGEVFSFTVVLPSGGRVRNGTPLLSLLVIASLSLYFAHRRLIEMRKQNEAKYSNVVVDAVAEARIRKLLDPKATAEILGCTPETLAVWRCERRYPLRFVRVGRRIFYRPEDIESFIEVRSATGTSEATATKPRSQRPNQKSRVA